jgi:hypothetical protein
MDLFEQHERFEIEILDALKSIRLLDSLIFGGGTMLRLCHELNRYSADLDLWKAVNISDEQILEKMENYFKKSYEITDAQLKHYTILMEIRSSRYPKRLKIEIRRELKEWEFEDKIAFSPYSNRQVLLKGHTLRQTLKNKIDALINRGEIRDAFDMEFILRQGEPFPPLPENKIKKALQQIDGFKRRDFKVTLGSVIEKGLRDYYIKNGFNFLQKKLSNERR